LWCRAKRREEKRREAEDHKLSRNIFWRGTSLCFNNVLAPQQGIWAAETKI
jgi:hypothetical protein